MKKIVFTMMCLGMMASLSQAQMKCAPGKCGGAMKDNTVIKKQKSSTHCAVCGMKLTLFPKTRYRAKVKGKEQQYCSIHCVVGDIRKGAKLTDIEVTDVSTFKYIDAKKAYYVIRKGHKGTMSMVSKLAFGSKKNASIFAKKYHTNIVTFDDAIENTQKDY